MILRLRKYLGLDGPEGSEPTYVSRLTKAAPYAAPLLGAGASMVSGCRSPQAIQSPSAAAAIAFSNSPPAAVSVALPNINLTSSSTGPKPVAVSAGTGPNIIVKKYPRSSLNLGARHTNYDNERGNVTQGYGNFRWFWDNSPPSVGSLGTEFYAGTDSRGLDLNGHYGRIFFNDVMVRAMGEVGFEDVDDVEDYLTRWGAGAEMKLRLTEDLDLDVSGKYTDVEGDGVDAYNGWTKEGNLWLRAGKQRIGAGAIHTDFESDRTGEKRGGLGGQLSYKRLLGWLRVWFWLWTRWTISWNYYNICYNFRFHRFFFQKVPKIIEINIIK